MGAGESTTVKDEVAKYEYYHKTINHRLSCLEDGDKLKEERITYLMGRNKELQEQLSQHNSYIATMMPSLERANENIVTVNSKFQGLTQKVDINEMSRKRQFNPIQQKPNVDTTYLHREIMALDSKHTELAKEVDKNKLSRQQQFNSIQQHRGDITSLNKQIVTLNSNIQGLTKTVAINESSGKKKLNSFEQRQVDNINDFVEQIMALDSKHTELAKELNQYKLSRQQLFNSFKTNFCGLLTSMDEQIMALDSKHTELSNEVHMNKLSRQQQLNSNSSQQNLRGDITSLNKQIMTLESKHTELSKEVDMNKLSRQQQFSSIQIQQNLRGDITSLNKQIKVLDSKQTKLSKDLEKVDSSKEQEFNSLHQKICDDIASLNKQCHAMKESCDKADSLTTLQHLLNKLHFRATEQHMLTQEIDTLKKDVKSLTENVKDVGRDNRIAFSAGKIFISPVQLREEMGWIKMSECDSVLVTNPSFSQADVIFTAPAHGTYAFYGELRQTGSGQLMVAMQGISGIKYYFGKTSGNSPQCCGLAVMKLEAKESVWIVVKLINGTAKMKEYRFSGWCMR